MSIDLKPSNGVVSVILSFVNVVNERTLYNRIRLSDVPTQRTGTRSLGWNEMTLTSPDAVSCVDEFTSRNLSTESVPEGRTTAPLRLLSAALSIPVVEANKFFFSSPTSSSPSSKPLSPSSSSTIPCTSLSSRLRFLAC